MAHGGTRKNKNDRGIEEGKLLLLAVQQRFNHLSVVLFMCHISECEIQFALSLIHKTVEEVICQSVERVGVPAVRCWPLFALIPRVAEAIHSLAAISPLPSPAGKDRAFPAPVLWCFFLAHYRLFLSPHPTPHPLFSKEKWN